MPKNRPKWRGYLWQAILCPVIILPGVGEQGVRQILAERGVAPPLGERQVNSDKATVAVLDALQALDIPLELHPPLVRRAWHAGTARQGAGIDTAIPRQRPIAAWNAIADRQSL